MEEAREVGVEDDIMVMLEPPIIMEEAPIMDEEAIMLAGGRNARVKAGNAVRAGGLGAASAYASLTGFNLLLLSTRLVSIEQRDNRTFTQAAEAPLEEM
ncbi:MAG: hypothetical protein Q9182_002182 [Xanthomendoza sp. 2 TL-2023]